MVNVHPIISWAARIAAAIIMLQTLYFKFSGAEESVYIFSTIGIEPWGRIGTGILELIASILILINATAWIGALLGLGLMGGAILIHLTILGIEVRGDGGYLFLLAMIVSGCCVIVLAYNTQQLSAVLNKILKKNN
jgi:uncharacterized membrane protein YphA (DoxX/SURF4 family)